jgi:hypothetical protein
MIEDLGFTVEVKYEGAEAEQAETCSH